MTHYQEENLDELLHRSIGLVLQNEEFCEDGFRPYWMDYMVGLTDALTALRKENERLKAFADEMQAFAAEMEKHPQTFRANQTVAYSIRLALKRHTLNPTGGQ